jgi:hypothetical protein
VKLRELAVPTVSEIGRRRSEVKRSFGYPLSGVVLAQPLENFAETAGSRLTILIALVMLQLCFTSDKRLKRKSRTRCFPFGIYFAHSGGLRRSVSF